MIYGRAGSGKSRRIYDLMKEDAKNATPSYLIVPEQQTVQCERKLLDILPPSAQLSSEVLNFSRLANLVFRHYGGLSYNYADKGSKMLIMWKNLRELSPLLTEYSLSAESNTAALASEMIAAVNELKAYCVSPAKLEKAASALADNTILKNKLLDLSLILSSYQNYFSESFSDVSDDLTKLASTLQCNDFFSGANVYIDSFTSFTAQEYAVIKEIFRSAANVTVALTLDTPASLEIHYESTADTAMRLSSMANELSLELSKEIATYSDERASAINYISDRLWSSDTIPHEHGDRGELRIIKCTTPYEEADAVANIVLRLMMDGMRCRDIAVIARDASTYRGIIDDAFEKAGIPYFFSQNSEMLSKAPIKFILSAIKIKLYNWRPDDVISYLKAGICDIDERDVDLLESYLSVWNIRGSRFIGDDWTMNPDGYTEYLTERGKEILRRVNECKNKLVTPLVRLFARLDSSDTASDMCRALYLFMEEIEMAAVLTERASTEYSLGRRRESAELIQLYNSVVKAIENISVSLNDDGITVKEFYEALRIMLDNVSVGAIPTAEDQVVIGSASMLRADEKKCAIVIGLNEGEFPQTVKENGIFSDGDKEKLEGLGISLSANTSTRSADELFYVYRALTSASSKLIMTYHTSDCAGTATPPSMAIERVRKLFPELKAERFSSLPYSESLLSKESAFEKLPLIKHTSEGRALFDYFDSIDTYKSRMPLLDASSRNDVCTLSEDTLKEVYGSSLRLTQSIIDTYVGCPFEYMCKRLFALNEIAPASFDYANFGTYVHYIFENYLKAAVADDKLGSAPDPLYIDKAVNAMADNYLSAYFRNGEANSPRLAYRFRRMRRLAVLIATNITREFEHSGFRPEFFELNIGKIGDDISVSPLVFKSSSGRGVYIVGKVDRVDLLHRDNDVFVKVVDYKSGKKAFSRKDIAKGQNIQLPLYLFALCDERQSEFRKAIGAKEDQRVIPAGALYMSSLIDPIEVSETSYNKEELLREAESSIARSGFLTSDIDVLKEIDSSLSPQYLCGAKADKSGSMKGDALLSGEEMDELRETLKDTVIGIADDMTSGCMNAAPTRSNNKFRCENCNMRAVCRAKRKS